MLNLRTPGADSTQVPAHQHAITRTFALTALFALLVLIVLRHLFGSVSVSAGVS